MFIPARDSEILPLFQDADEITAYCLAKPGQQAAILQSLIERLAKEGKTIPGMTCDIQRPQ